MKALRALMLASVCALSTTGATSAPLLDVERSDTNMIIAGAPAIARATETPATTEPTTTTESTTTEPTTTEPTTTVAETTTSTTTTVTEIPTTTTPATATGTTTTPAVDPTAGQEDTGVLPAGQAP